MQPAYESDDSSDVHGEDPDDAASVIAISINAQQSRLASSKTPTIEKTHALELGLDGADDPDCHEDYPPAISASLRPQESSTSYRAPSPWRAQPRIFETPNETPASDKHAVHPAAKSESWSTHFISALASISKSIHFSHLGDTWQVRPKLARSRFESLASRKAANPPARSTQPDIENTGRSITSDDDIQSGCREGGAFTNNDENPPAALPLSMPNMTTMSPQLLMTSAPSLRRSASAQSFVLTSALSPVSSLGDDARFEHIQGQVNSRLRAIKDGWQDAGIRFPTFRGIPTIAALSFDSLRPDFAFARNLGSRAGTGQPPFAGPSVVGRPARTVPMAAKAAETSRVFTDSFGQACSDLTGDLVVLGGYRGSVLRSAEPPYRQVWVPIKVGLNVRKVDLEVGLEPEDDQNMRDKVFPSGMLTHIGPVSISKRLFAQLHACQNAQSGKLRVHNYGYDWRLDPNLLSQQLIAYLEALPCNQPHVPKHERGATVIAHSLGGLITRHVINQRPDLVAGVVYAGTPISAVGILGPMRNGDDVLLSSRVLTAQVNFTIRTSFALLPLDGKAFINPETKEEFLVDFFDPKTWQEYCLSPCIARPLPPLTASVPSSLPSMVNLLASKLPSRRNSVPSAGAPSSVASRPRSDTLDPNMASKARVDQTTISPDVIAVTSKNGVKLQSASDSVATAVTIPYDRAMSYLTRVLADVKRFKQELAYRSEIGNENRYPPAAVMYGKSTPTIYGARVTDREAIKRSDAYDSIIFRSGDGVVLSKAAMLPEGYQNIPGGRVSSTRGHVTLLGDLDGVGRALQAVINARRDGIGLGPDDAKISTS